jgi:hypothetical protein
MITVNGRNGRLRNNQHRVQAVFKQPPANGDSHANITRAGRDALAGGEGQPGCANANNSMGKSSNASSTCSGKSSKQLLCDYNACWADALAGDGGGVGCANACDSVG